MSSSSAFLARARSESRIQRIVRIMGARPFFDSLTEAQREALPFEWGGWRRSEQAVPPGDWLTWLILAGRGFGKTRTGAETVREIVESGQAGRIALVGRTSADVRDTMVEGESGIRAQSPPAWRPKYEPSKRRLVWPNGAIATCYAADKPDQLRGPQHDFGWADELASWRYVEAWDNLKFGLRLGSLPRCVVTTTPKPTKLMRSLVKDARRLALECPTCHAAPGVACRRGPAPLGHPDDARGIPTTPSVVITSGSTYDNAGNLALPFFQEVTKKYEGTRVGRQELLAEMLDDVEGALWTRKMLEDLRVPLDPATLKAVLPTMQRIVVAMDPATTTEAYSAETGIIGVGIGDDEEGYVLADRSAKLSPTGWGRRGVKLVHELGADAIVVEVNNGGDLIAPVIRELDRNIRIVEVKASRGKITRAEPIAALYEQGRVHHVGFFAELEDQQCAWGPMGPEISADRVDALVWGLSELMLDEDGPLAVA